MSNTAQRHTKRRVVSIHWRETDICMTCMWCWLFVVMREHVTGVIRCVLIVLWWQEQHWLFRQHFLVDSWDLLIIWNILNISRLFFWAQRRLPAFHWLHLELAVDLCAWQCQEMNGSDAESCPLSSSRFTITLCRRLSNKKKVCCCFLLFSRTFISLHISFHSRTDSFCRRRVGRTFDWNCCPSSDSGGWRPCDLHSWHPDSPSTPQGHWLWPPETPRRPSASPCNRKTATTNRKILN